MPRYLALLLLVGCTSSNSASVAPAAKEIEAAMRAGFLRHDLDAYLAAWAPDGRLIAGRTATPDAHDLVLDRAQIEATKRLRFMTPGADGAKMTFDWKDASTVETTFIMEGYVDGATEKYVTRRADDGRWLIVENRFWPRILESNGKKTEFGAAHWNSRDEEVRAAKGDRVRREALTAAKRHGEAYALAKSITTREDATSADWLARANVALLVGDAEDAVASAKKVESGKRPAWAK